MSELAHTPRPCGHTVSFKKIDVFCTKTCGRPHWNTPLVRKMSALENPLTCGRLLWTAPNFSLILLLFFGKISLCENKNCKTRSFYRVT